MKFAVISAQRFQSHLQQQAQARHKRVAKMMTAIVIAAGKFTQVLEGDKEKEGEKEDCIV